MSSEYTTIAEDIDPSVSFAIALVISRLWYHSDWFWGLPPLLTITVNPLWWFIPCHYILVVHECPVVTSVSIFVILFCLACVARLAIIMVGLSFLSLLGYIIVKALSAAGRFSAPPAQKVCIAVGGCADAGDSFAGKLGQRYLGLQEQVVDKVYSYGLYLSSRPQRRESGARGGQEGGRNDHRYQDRIHDRIHDPEDDRIRDPGYESDDHPGHDKRRRQSRSQHEFRRHMV